MYFLSACLWFIDHTHSTVLMRLRMLKLSVGKGRQVIKQLCSRVLQYYNKIRYGGYRARGVCAPLALVGHAILCSVHSLCRGFCTIVLHSWCFQCICRAKSEYDEYREKFRLFDSALFCMPPDHRLRRFCNKVLTSQLDAPISGQTMESQELKVFFAARFKFIVWWVMVSMNC